MQEHLTLEQLSDLLDGEATDDARAHTSTCDRCSAAATRMRDARSVISEEVALSPGVLDAAVAAGVAALTATTSNIQPLAARRLPTPLPWLAAVAAVLVGLLGIGALVLANDGAERQDADTFATGADATAEQSLDDAGGGATAAGGDGGSAAMEGAPAPDAGGELRAHSPAPQRAFDTEEQVITYLQESGDSLSTTATACSAEATAMLEAPLERLRSEDVLWQAGSGALWVDPAARRAVLMRPGGCSLLADLRY